MSGDSEERVWAREVARRRAMVASRDRSGGASGYDVTMSRLRRAVARRLQWARPAVRAAAGAGITVDRGAVDVGDLQVLLAPLCEAGDIDAARRLVLLARAADPARPELLAMDAELSMLAGRWPEAIARWRRMLELFGDDGPEEVRARLSLALRQAGSSIEARRLLDGAPAPRTTSGRIAVGFERGAAAMDERRFADAEGLWRHLLEDPGLDDGLRAVVREALTSTLRAQGRTPDADLLPESLLVADHADRYLERVERVDRLERIRPRTVGARPAAGPQPSCSVLVAVGAVPAGMRHSERLVATLRSLAAQEQVMVETILVGPDAAGVAASVRVEAGLEEALLAAVHAQTDVGAWEAARRRATGDVIVLLEPGTLLAPDALAHFWDALAADPQVGLVYADEDSVDGLGVRSGPQLRPGWDPDLLLTQPYMGRAVAFRSVAVEQAGGIPPLEEAPVRPEHALVLTVWSLALRVSLQAATRGGPTPVRHLPRVLLHHRADVPPGSERGIWEAGASWAVEERAASAVVAARLAEAGVDRSVEPSPWGVPLRVASPLPDRTVRVSVVIPTRDRHELLAACVEGVLSERDGGTVVRSRIAVELVIVDNDSVEPSAVELLERLRGEADVQVIAGPGGFNFSKLVNAGVQAATGEVCVLLNNDVTPIGTGWIGELVGHALRPDVGVVGAILLHPDERVQHAGVLVGVNGTAEHAFREWPGEAAGYLSLLRSTRRTSAVTAACMAVRRDVYLSLGGFDEVGLPVELNDVDFCLRAEAAGLCVLWTPHARLIHLEGGTRSRPGAPGTAPPVTATPGRSAEVERQRACFRDRWRHRLGGDPHYHPALADRGATYLLRTVT